jgi:peptidyl-dipeptidase Dcp
MKQFITITILCCVFFGSKTFSQNPLLEPYNTPHGIIPFEKVKPEHIIPAFQQALQEDRQTVQSIVGNKKPADFRNTIIPFVTIGSKRQVISFYTTRINQAYGTDEINQINTEVRKLFTEYLDEVRYNTQLFDRIKSVYEKKEDLNLSQEELTVLDNTFSWFKRSGLDLSKEKQERLKQIRVRLSELTNQFDQNVIKDRDRDFFHLTQEADLAGLPDWVVASAADYARSKNVEGWAFKNQSDLLAQFMEYAERRDLREKMTLQQRRIGNNDNEYNNLEIAKEILNLRLEMANLLGYASYSQYVLEETMAESTDQVMNFINTTKDKVKDASQKDLQKIKDFAKSMGFDDKLQRWDFAYYGKKYSATQLQFNADDIMPWLPVEHIIQSCFEMIREMFGITFIKNQQLPKYHADIIPYEIYDEKGNIKAVMYLDLYEREGKAGGAMLGTLRLQNKEEGENQIPVMINLCNFQNPVGEAPSLMTIWDLSTFLHELGHGLHNVLSDVTYRSVSGLNLRYGDFLELPSMLLQKWAYEPEFLARIPRHYQTGEALSADIIEKIVQSERENKAFYTMNYNIPNEALDIALHDIREPIRENLCVWEYNFMKEYSLLPSIEGTCIIPNFSHIFSYGYASGLYTYAWSDMMAWDIFNEFKKNGIFNPVTAKRFEKEILSKGGTVHPRELFKNFMGRDISMEAFLESFD